MKKAVKSLLKDMGPKLAGSDNRSTFLILISVSFVTAVWCHVLPHLTLFTPNRK